MTNFKMAALYCAAEKDLPSISEMLTQIQCTKRAIKVSPTDTLEVRFVEVDEEYEQGVLKSSPNERLILVPLFTPKLVLNERVVEDIVLVITQQKETAIVVPVYCRPISSSADLPWSALAWAGQPIQSDSKPRALSEYPANALDTATLNAATTLKSAAQKFIDTTTQS